jgi:glucose-1-phosphate thymidylyltransferase
MKKALKVIIPVAGEGTRLRPHTFTTPKSLIPVAGKPILAHILDPLMPLDPDEVVFVLGHLGDQIMAFVKRNYDFRSSFVQQNDLLGLGFAIHLALKEIDRSPILVILGDTIAKMDFTRLTSKGGNIVGLKKVADPRRFGTAIVEKGRIIAFEEKPRNPKSDLAIVGVYYFEDSSILKSHLDKLIGLGKKTSGEIQLTDALEFMIKDGHEFRPVDVDGWFDCGKRETILETNRVLLSDFSEVGDYPGSVIIPPVYISPTAKIEESVIGPYVSISDKASIRRSIIRDSVVGKRASIEFSLLDASLIGDKAIVKGTYSRLNVGESSEFGFS